MYNFRELKIWQKSRELVKKVYLTSKDFPVEEQYLLSYQIRRYSVSIPSNVAEGSGRDTDKHFCRFLDIANSSAFELETQILLTQNPGYISSEISNIIIADIQ